MKRSHLAQRMKLCLSANITNPLYNSMQLEECLMDGWITFDILNRGIKLSAYLSVRSWKCILCVLYIHICHYYFNQLGKYVLCTVKMFLKNIILNLSDHILFIYDLKSSFWPTLKLCSAALLMPLTTWLTTTFPHKFLLLTLSRNFQASPRWWVLVCCWLSWSTNIL